jgi:hypothetical protein
MSELNEADRKAFDEYWNSNGGFMPYASALRYYSEGIKHARAEKLDAFEQTSWLMNHKNERIKELEDQLETVQTLFDSSLTDYEWQSKRIKELEAENNRLMYSPDTIYSEKIHAQFLHIGELEAEVTMWKEVSAVRLQTMRKQAMDLEALQSPSSAKDTPDMREISAASDKFAKGNHDKSEGFDRGAQWVLSKLKSSPVSVDINRELLEALQAVSDWWFKQRGGIFPFKQVEAALSKASPPKQSGDEGPIPEDYYINYNPPK